MTTAGPHTVFTTDLTDTEQTNLRSVSDVLPFWNVHDVPGVLVFYNEDITWINQGLEETYHGKQEVGEFLGRMFSAFPDLHFAVTHKIARGNNVAEQWVIHGTHRGAFMGIPPTGRPVEIQGMSMVELRDGKFLRDQFYWDAGSVLRQMGLMPPLSVGERPWGKAVLWAAVHGRPVGGALGGLTGVWLVRKAWRAVRR